MGVGLLLLLTGEEGGALKDEQQLASGRPTKIDPVPGKADQR